MPTYEIKDIIGFDMMDSNGNIVVSYKDPLFDKSKSKLSREEKLNPSNIKKIIFNPPATIVIFKDDTKVVVKAYNEEFDEEKGFLMAMAKVMFESRTEFNRVIDKGIENSYKTK